MKDLDLSEHMSERQTKGEHYTHRRASDEASLVAVMLAILAVLCLLTFLLSSYILYKPTFITYAMSNEPRCHRYLDFRELTGYYDSETEQCIAKTKTGSYILDPMYY